METGSIGCAVKAAAEAVTEGKISAVFERSVHLESGEMIITLGGLDLPAHPFTIRCPNSPGRLRPGQEFMLGEGVLSIPDCCVLELVDYDIFSPAMKVEAMAGAPEMLFALQAARMVVATTSFRDGFHSFVMGGPMHGVISQAVLPLIQQMGDALRGRNWETMVSVGVGLGGVGEGLTPSGDDFLVGIMAALHFHRASGGTGPDTGHLEALAQKAAQRTSSFSGQNIRAAAGGQVADVVAQWLISVHMGDSEGVKIDTRDLLSFGHSSGVDTFAGMVMALSSVLEER
jgi:hypothetical protein